MNLRTDNSPWPISNTLRHLIQDTLTTAGIAQETGAIISFRDPGYRPDSGGFHPVEIAVGPGGCIEYITDFSYFGRPPHCELGKELDFDFSLGLFQHFGVEYPISSGRELFSLWESNFLAYHQMKAYTVSIEPMG